MRVIVEGVQFPLDPYEVGRIHMSRFVSTSQPLGPRVLKVKLLVGYMSTSHDQLKGAKGIK